MYSDVGTCFKKSSICWAELLSVDLKNKVNDASRVTMTTRTVQGCRLYCEGPVTVQQLVYGEHSWILDPDGSR